MELLFAFLCVVVRNVCRAVNVCASRRRFVASPPRRATAEAGGYWDAAKVLRILLLFMAFAALPNHRPRRFLYPSAYFYPRPNLMPPDNHTAMTGYVGRSSNITYLAPPAHILEFR